MRCSAVSTLMMAAVIGEAVAGPTHAHLHHRALQKKEVDWESLDWANMKIDWKDAYEKGKASSTVPAPVAVAPPKSIPTPAAAPNKAASPASSAADNVSAASIVDTSDDESLLGGLIGVSNGRTSFGTPSPGDGKLGDNHLGNIGIPYGANIIKVGSTSGYDFTNTFINTSPNNMVINLWQKVGPNKDLLSGHALAPKQTTLTFALKPGQKQIVAFQDDTQIGWTEVCDVYTASGGYASVWGEAQFRSDGSGFDYSAIMSKAGNNYDMVISSEENNCKSSQTENYWLTADKPIGGSDGSCFVPGHTMHMTTKMGGVMS